MMPTTLVLTFDQALDPKSAENANNYVVIGPKGHRIEILQAVYNPANMTVTLHPRERISIHWPYEMTVVGDSPAGVRSLEGQLLDGKDTGKPGSNFHLVLTWRQLVLRNVSLAFHARYHLLPRARHSPVPARPDRSLIDQPYAVRPSGGQIARRISSTSSVSVRGGPKFQPPRTTEHGGYTIGNQPGNGSGTIDSNQPGNGGGTAGDFRPNEAVSEDSRHQSARRTRR
jgi:hypothetical protein